MPHAPGSDAPAAEKADNEADNASHPKQDGPTTHGLCRACLGFDCRSQRLIMNDAIGGKHCAGNDVGDE